MSQPIYDLNRIENSFRSISIIYSYFFIKVILYYSYINHTDDISFCKLNVV